MSSEAYKMCLLIRCLQTETFEKKRAEALENKDDGGV